MLVEVTIPVTHLVVVGTAALADDLVDLAHVAGVDGVSAVEPRTARAELAVLGPRDALVVLDHGLAATGPLLADAPARAGRLRRRARAPAAPRNAAPSTSAGSASTTTALARLTGPAGLDLGPVGAREIALAILAEIAAVAQRARRRGPLRETAPAHHALTPARGPAPARPGASFRRRPVHRTRHNNHERSTIMATIETDRPGTVQGEVRMLIDGELVEAASGQALRQRQPGHRRGAR